MELWWRCFYVYIKVFLCVYIGFTLQHKAKVVLLFHSKLLHFIHHHYFDMLRFSTLSPEVIVLAISKLKGKRNPCNVKRATWALEKPCWQCKNLGELHMLIAAKIFDRFDYPFIILGQISKKLTKFSKQEVLVIYKGNYHSNLSLVSRTLWNEWTAKNFILTIQMLRNYCNHATARIFKTVIKVKQFSFLFHS